VLLASGSIIGSTTVSYIFLTYILSYATKEGGFGYSTILTFTLIGACVWMSFMPWASTIADRIGLRKVMMWGWGGLMLFGVLLLPAVSTGSTPLTLAVMVATAVFIGITYGPVAAMFAGLFDTRIRYSGTSISYQLGSLLGGGIAPLVATALFAGWNSIVPIIIYIVAVGLLSMTCVYFATHVSAPGQAELPYRTD
jgi:MFS family permease